MLEAGAHSHLQHICLLPWTTDSNELVWFTGMQSSVRKEKVAISPGSTTVFPHAKQGKHKHRRTSPVTLMCCVRSATHTQSHQQQAAITRNAPAFQIWPDRVTLPPLSSLPCPLSSSWPSPSSSSSCFIYLRPNQEVTVRQTQANLKLELWCLLDYVFRFVPIRYWYPILVRYQLENKYWILSDFN